MAVPQQLAEGETKSVELPPPGVSMVQEVKLGLHSIAIFKLGIQKSKVYVRDYPHWERAFDAAMDKAGL